MAGGNNSNSGNQEATQILAQELQEASFEGPPQECGDPS